MRVLIPVVMAVLVVGVAPAAAGRDIWREQSEKTVEVRGFGTLEVINARGRIEFTPSPDGKLHVTALKIVRVEGLDRAKELARDIVVEAGADGDRYRIEVRYPKHRNIHIDFWDFFKVDGVNVPVYEVRLTCQVPGSLAIEARETSGDIRSEGLPGSQMLRSTSGDVVVLAAAGPVEASSTSGDLQITGAGATRARTVSGDIDLERVAGPLRVSTTSGSINVSGAQDSLALSSVSGDIRVDRAPRGLDVGTTSGEIVAREVSGSVKAGSTSGDLWLSLRGPLRGLEASTSSGEIRVNLDATIACALDMRTSSGTIAVDVPMQMKRATRRSVTGAIRGGDTPVVLHTSSGDITVAGGGQ